MRPLAAIMEHSARNNSRRAPNEHLDRRGIVTNGSMVIPRIGVAGDLCEPIDVEAIWSRTADGPWDLIVWGEIEVYVAFSGGVVGHVEEDLRLDLVGSERQKRWSTDRSERVS